MLPAAVLATWAAGLALGAASVVGRRVVGRGYTWLSLGVASGFGVAAALAGAGPWAGAGAALGAAGVIAFARPFVSAVLGAAAAVCLLIAAGLVDDPLLAVTGAVLLGGVTSEMMLGHWFLVDPRLPRSELRRLDLIGGAGVLFEIGAVLVLGGLPWAPDDALVGIAWVVLACSTLGLMAMVWAALGERGYSGVMAATGLSYLAVLTAAGTAVLGRLLVAA